MSRVLRPRTGGRSATRSSNIDSTGLKKTMCCNQNETHFFPEPEIKKNRHGCLRNISPKNESNCISIIMET